MPIAPEDHVSLVTGASTGIGAAIAEKLAQRGSCVAVHYRANEVDANRVVKQIEERGGRAFVVQADLAKADSAAALVGSVLDRAHRLDVLVNNAGSIIERHRLLEITDEFWQDVMETNLGSVLRVTRAAVPSMVERRSGVILTLARWLHAMEEAWGSSPMPPPRPRFCA